MAGEVQWSVGLLLVFNLVGLWIALYCWTETPSPPFLV